MRLSGDDGDREPELRAQPPFCKQTVSSYYVYVYSDVFHAPTPTCEWIRHPCISTAREIGANRPDVFSRYKKTNTCLLIYISGPVDGNIARKHAQKLTKCSDLRVEVNRMWQCLTPVVLVVLGSLSTVDAGIVRWLDIISCHHNLQHF